MVVEWLALGIGILALITSIITISLSYRTQRTSLIHDLAMKRINAYQRADGEGNKAYEERLVNFFEYLALLIIKKEISEKIAKELFLDDLRNLFKFHKEIISRNNSWDYIHQLNTKWNLKIQPQKQKITIEKEKNIFRRLEEIGIKSQRKKKAKKKPRKKKKLIR